MSGYDDDDDVQISRRLKDALISDIVMEDLSHEADDLLARRLRKWELTSHLARQLDDLLRTWPPNADVERCRSITHAATAA